MCFPYIKRYYYGRNFRISGIKHGQNVPIMCELPALEIRYFLMLLYIPS